MCKGYTLLRQTRLFDMRMYDDNLALKSLKLVYII